MKTSLELRVAGCLVARTRSRLFICKAYSWTSTSRSKHRSVFLAVYGLVYFFFARRSKIAAAASCCTFIVHIKNVLLHLQSLQGLESGGSGQGLHGSLPPGLPPHLAATGVILRGEHFILVKTLVVGQVTVDSVKNTKIKMVATYLNNNAF